MKANQRHHSVHPASGVKPNLAANQKPNYTPPEKVVASNPSLAGKVAVDTINARVNAASTEIDLPDDDCNDPDDPECDDRKKGRTFVY